ncbi:hypothetical protein RO22_09275 [Halomonas sp. KHS3]|nr:hypothetical protein RO22_09275 [Halomonas sp. KHS3]
MANEMITRLSLISELDEADKLVENGLYQRESLSFIYNQNITEYSVCVHIVANHLLCKDIFVAFQICSIITRLVLNFSGALIENVLASEIHDILGIPKNHEFEKRVRSGIRGRDLGILYFLICSALPKNTADDPKTMIAGIRLALEKINLSLELLREEARKEIESIANDLGSSKLKAIRLLSIAGFDNFSKIPLTTSGLNVSNLSLPRVYLGDGTEVDIFRNDNSQLKDVGIEEIFDELYAGQKWVERFSEACTA